ncbi:hypothetical protein BU17DRAFT_70860 [Hysterangium stoloniferum]|nr:hypothetical protein BU17DRAFT_70860 [Hysterangium stoloniferum]
MTAEQVNSTARVIQPATVTQYGQVFLRVAFDKPVAVTAPEALSFAHCLEKETEKEMKQMKQDKRASSTGSCTLSSNAKAISPKWKEAELDLGAPKLDNERQHN